MTIHKLHNDTFSLEDKVVLITGAARGLGLGYATAAAAAGAHVVLNDSDQKGLEASVEKLRGEGYQCSASHFDVTSEQAVKKGVADILVGQGRIDVLVNNAGNQNRKPFLDYSLAEWEAIMSVHVTGSFLVTQSVARHMVGRGDGSIIMIGSIVIESTRGTIAPYVTAKGALTAFAKQLAVELGPQGVRCNVIAPGLFETEFNRALIDKPEIYSAVKEKVPLRRWGQPSDIAPVMVYLSSNAGRVRQRTHLHGRRRNCCSFVSS
jgi:gluconate 5-dehydrogenase